MQVVGVFLLILSIWTMYCGVNSFNPFSILLAILSSPTGAQGIIAQAKSEVAASVAPASATSGGSVNPAGDVLPAPASGPAPAILQTQTTGPSAVQAEQAYAFGQLASKYGITDTANQQALVQLWNHESGWRANAMNSSSGAFGIPQAYPSTKIPGGTSATAQQQIDWGLQYIVSKYGTPAKAWAFEMSHSPNWY
jgi:hypothetical protein